MILLNHSAVSRPKSKLPASPPATENPGKGLRLNAAHPTPRFGSAPGPQFNEDDDIEGIYARANITQVETKPLIALGSLHVPQALRKTKVVLEGRGVKISHAKAGGLYREDYPLSYTDIIRVETVEGILSSILIFSTDEGKILVRNLDKKAAREFAKTINNQINQWKAKKSINIERN